MKIPSLEMLDFDDKEEDCDGIRKNYFFLLFKDKYIYIHFNICIRHFYKVRLLGFLNR